MSQPSLRRIMTGLLLALLLAACAKSGLQEPAGPEPPTPPPAESPQPAPRPEPAPLAFTLTVNGREVTDGAVVEADFYTPAELRLRFPVAMDRRSVEYIRKRLPDGTTIDWEDDQTSRLQVPPGDSFAINLADVRSLDGSAVVKAGLVEVRRPEYSRLSLYRPEELMAGREGVAGRWRLAAHQNGIALSPDRTQALFFSPDPFGEPRPPWLVDLTTGQERPVPVEDADHWFSAGGWLLDGRIYLLGDTLWVSDPEGKEWREVAADLFNWVSRLSPDATRIATWSPTEPETLLVVDFQGQKRQVKGPFRRPGDDAGISIAWSPDGQWLAGSDHDNQATGEGPRIRIVDAVGDRPGRTIEGVTLVTWLSTGDLVAYRRPPRGQRGDPDPGARGELLRIDPTGQERPLLDRWAQPSPDGAYLLYSEWDGKRQVLYLVESASGRQVELPLRHWARWADQGEIMVLEGPLNVAPPAAAVRPLAYTVRVGGAELQPGGAALAHRARETEVQIIFARPVDRQSAEEAISLTLPAGSQLTWKGEDRLTLTVPPGETFLIHPMDARSADGQGKVEGMPVVIYRLRPFQIRLYSFEAALEGRTEVLGEWELPGFSGGLALSPDRSQALLYHFGDYLSAGPPAVLVDLATGQWRPLDLPGLNTHRHAYGGWLPDGRLLVVGTHVWVGDGRGEAMKTLTQKPRWIWTAAVSPDGARVALWEPGLRGGVAVVDLKNGKEHLVEGLIPPTFQNGSVHLAWSPDGKQLAGTAWDHDDQGWWEIQIAVVDHQTGEQVRTIADAAVSAWVEAGIIGQRQYWETREFALLLFTEAGERELGDTWFRLSPDGRYLLQADPQSQSIALYALEIATGKRVKLPFAEMLQFTEQGDLLHVQL